MLNLYALVFIILQQLNSLFQMNVVLVLQLAKKSKQSFYVSNLNTTEYIKRYKAGLKTKNGLYKFLI